MMFKKQKKVDYKARLEHKLYLARENPEPIFDLSDCDLKHIPSGTFSLCRVFLKEVLLLGNNRLENLHSGGALADLRNLVILDLHNNHLHILPDDIKLLINLRELYLNDNRFKKIPESITLLYNLRILDVSNNSLEKLPETMGNLESLEKLSIFGNKNLRKLPKSICGAHNLKELLLDSEKILYPPSEVCKQGVTAIIKYISEDCGIPYERTVPTQRKHEKDTLEQEKFSSYMSSLQEFQEKILQLEKLKEQKQQELLAIEKNKEILQQQELKLHDEHRASKQKLLSELIKDQEELENELLKIQQEKELERQHLIQELQEEENKTETSINKLLELSRKPHAELLEYEARENARLFEAVHKNQSDLKRQEIIKDMQSILEVEAEQFENYRKNNDEVMRTILSEEIEMNQYLDSIIESKGKHQEKLAAQLEEDNKLQMAAVGALLERSDARSWSLIQQINFVTAKLAKLTAIELDKKKLQISAQLNDLSQKRIDLSMMLLDLLNEQNERRNELLSTLRQLEDKSGMEDFWLLQYQKLLERRPKFLENVQRNVEPELLQEMLMAGVLHYLPFLSPWAHSKEALSEVTDDALLEVGVIHGSDRERIINAINNYLESQKKVADPFSELPQPSAPLPEAVAEATTLNVTTTVTSATAAECVICLDKSCTIVFVPCGHLCTCLDCSKTVELCPLCRGEIQKKLQVILP